ncbi:MAG: redox-regulated ATPase YchF [Actinomycetota bacterium]|nr:redox-regulated ATPase YchF [Actinomycetota bacterium]
MKVGIVGLAKSGKTTVFNALTGSSAQTGTFGAQKANLAVIKVPDKRVDYLASIFNPRKMVYAEISFVDVPGPSDETKGSLGGTKNIDMIKGVDTLAVVVRAFMDESFLLEETVDPLRDFRAVESELMVIDLIMLEKKLERLEKEGKRGIEHDLVKRCKDSLDKEKPLRLLDFNEAELKLLSGFQLLSLKPLLILANTGEIRSADLAPLKDFAKKQQTPVIDFCGAIEMELSEMSEDEQREFLFELGIGESARDRFIRAAYELSNLISFLTVGEDEVRAWSIKKGALAPQAGGKVHSDIERGFIRAEVVSYEDFVNYNSLSKAKEAGKVRLEGKQYVVKDGDIINFRFNV